jgi:hypothetical protein
VAHRIFFSSAVPEIIFFLVCFWDFFVCKISPCPPPLSDEDVFKIIVSADFYLLVHLNRTTSVLFVPCITTNSWYIKYMWKKTKSIKQDLDKNCSGHEKRTAEEGVSSSKRRWVEEEITLSQGGNRLLFSFVCLRRAKVLQGQYGLYIFLCYYVKSLICKQIVLSLFLGGGGVRFLNNRSLLAGAGTLSSRAITGGGWLVHRYIEVPRWI